MKEEKTKKILFVCTGNTCRSPMAEAIARSILKRWGEKNVVVSSAGLSVAKGDGLNPYSATMLARNGLKLEGFTSTPLTDGLLDEAYAVVCMTENQRKAIEEKRAFDFFSSG
jgi:protein-tyrosine phosphatase